MKVNLGAMVNEAELFFMQLSTLDNNFPRKFNQVVNINDSVAKKK